MQYSNVARAVDTDGLFKNSTMPNWLRFSTISKWATDNAGATDCSAKCASCEKEWKTILAEDRGDEAVHLLELNPKEKTPCGLAYKFVCDTCYKLTQP